MKRPTVGRTYWATDLKESVDLIAVERAGGVHTSEHSVCTIRRASGETIGNYSAALLRKCQPYVTQGVERYREYVRRSREKHKDARLASERAYRAANRAELNARARQRYVEKRDELRAYRKAWAAKNPEKVKAAKARYKAANPERVRAMSRELYARNADSKRGRARELYGKRREEILARKRFMRYGITDAQWAAMLSAQDGACAVCKVPFSGKPHVDHDHGTGFVRGLLCFSCNASIGQANECADILRALADYLDEAEEAQRERTA